MVLSDVVIRKHQAFGRGNVNISQGGGHLELKYQTLKNLCEKAIRGRMQISTDAVNLIGGYIGSDTQELIDEAMELAILSKKKRINAVHIMKARETLLKRR